MGQPSQNIADRYQVELNTTWHEWFDGHAEHVRLPGEFRETSQSEFLLDRAPAIVWPGLMLPDSLPLIGNEYGDWLCVRVDSENRFSEVIHWYHGGGDWIPVGRTVAEAALHDVVDQFRPRQGQVLRGATESIAPDHVADVMERLRDEGFRRWLAVSLGESSNQPTALDCVLEALASCNYRMHCSRCTMQVGPSMLRFAIKLNIRFNGQFELLPTSRFRNDWE